MLKFFLILSILFQDPPLAITSPQPGATLRGLVEIQGRMNIPGFVSAELAFTFDASASDPAASWFPIQTFPQPVLNPSLASWDTTALTDGDYTLRLRVFLQDGTFQDVTVTGLQLRNSEPVPTVTFAPTLPEFNFQSLNETPEALLQPSATAALAYPTSTPLPSNPASLTTSSIFTVFWQSSLIVLVLFAFFSFILRLRKNT